MSPGWSPGFLDSDPGPLGQNFIREGGEHEGQAGRRDGVPKITVVPTTSFLSLEAPSACTWGWSVGLYPRLSWRICGDAGLPGHSGAWLGPAASAAVMLGPHSPEQVGVTGVSWPIYWLRAESSAVCRACRFTKSTLRPAFFKLTYVLPLL